MPGHAAPVCELEDRADRRYLAEFVIPPDSALIGEDPVHAFSKKYPTYEGFEIARDYHVFYPERDQVEIAANDLLLVKGSPNDLIAILRDKVVELPHLAEDMQPATGEKESLIVELISPILTIGREAPRDPSSKGS